MAVDEAARPAKSTDVFDTLRIVAAVMVIYWHAYALTGHSQPVLPWIGRADVAYGKVAVGAFFTMSGFLITSSWTRRPSAKTYVRNRGGRIFPGLIVCVLLCALVLGPIVTTATNYFTKRETWEFIFHDITLWKVRYTLPGVFTDNPYRFSVNGSLWTLPYELFAYVGVFALGVLGILGRRTIGIVFAVLVVLNLWLFDASQSAPPFIERQLGRLGLQMGDLIEMALFFGVGMLCFAFYEQISTRRPTWAAAAVAGIVVAGLVASHTLMIIGVATAVMVLGTLTWRPARLLRRR